MNSKLLTTILAAALCLPQVAFAARDGEGMEYTSAAEGFYGSIRTLYKSRDNGNRDDGSSIGADYSRLGVRGSLDLGGGLTGIYRYEWGINGDNGANTGSTRLSFVGLRGGFGEFKAGSHWAQGYNWVTSATDIASTGSGEFLPTGRVKNSFEYTTPDLQGFRGSFRIGADGGGKAENARAFAAGDPDVLAMPDTSSRAIDEWAVAAKFGGRGFSFGGVYEVVPDMPVIVPLFRVTVTTELASGGGVSVTSATESEPTAGMMTQKRQDAEFWAARAGYAGSNWAVNVWYGEHNTSKITPNRNGSRPSTRIPGQIGTEIRALPAQGGQTADDASVFSAAANADFGKFAIVGVFETRNNRWQQEDAFVVLNVDYKFTARSKAYFAYIANDYESNPGLDDEVRIGLRMDF